ncbi:unnamed protein product [Sphagnum troendelagicum]|uniref:t-SNARE coiled-coil homology domain-containing protein n=1 Tax=Sphagnum jensenii TaxID=128206 RepID=A0ABP0ZYU1_9BRYO
MATEVSKRGLAGPRDRRKTGKGNPFDSDEEETTTSRARNARKEPVRRGGPTSSSLAAAAASQTEELFSYGDSRPKSRYQSGNNNGGAYDDTYESHQGEADGEEYVNQAVLDLEKHALKKSQETTSTIKNCVRVAEDTMGIGVQTLITLHDQGIQIERTHEKAVQIDQHLSRGEKLLGSLGGVFSKSWKPKKTKKITGPMVRQVDNPQKKENPADRESLGLNGEAMNKKSGSSGMHDVTSVAGQLDAERDTQDDMLGELSTVISHMKEMSMDMNVEIQRQSPGIDHLSEDIQELNSRVKRANVRGQRLLRR